MNVIKKPVGRPRIAENSRLKRSIMIDDADLAIIANAGAGNNSAGVHNLVDFYKKYHAAKIADYVNQCTKAIQEQLANGKAWRVKLPAPQCEAEKSALDLFLSENKQTAGAEIILK